MFVHLILFLRLTARKEPTQENNPDTLYTLETSKEGISTEIDAILISIDNGQTELAKLAINHQSSTSNNINQITSSKYLSLSPLS